MTSRLWPRLAERLRAEERAQTMVEYGILLTLISAALILAMTSIATSVSGFFTSFAVGLTL